MAITTNDDAAVSWGGPADLTAWEALMWRTEGDHRTRSAGVVVEILDGEPDWDRLVAAHDRLSRRIPRLRERVVVPPLSFFAPAWSPDPHFDLDYHLQRFRLPEGGTIDDLYAAASVLATRPLDPQRPPWEALVIGGLPGGQAAYLFKAHHSLTDGVGLLQLLELAHGHGPEPGSREPVPEPSPRRTISSSGLLAERLVSSFTTVPAGIARDAAAAVGRFAGDPVGTATEAVRFGKSLRRVLNPPGAARSPILRDGGTGYRFATLDVPLNALKAAGKAAGGSINDAFLAGLLGGLRRYHEERGADVDYLPMAIPVSLRKADDPEGGNRFSAARFVAPVGEADPAARIAAIHRLIVDARNEPALGFTDLIAPVLGLLPDFALTQVSAQLTKVSDLQASNMTGISRTLYLAGAKVLRLYVVGPRPGVAVMATLLSYEGNCGIGLNFDPQVIPDTSMFLGCLHEGFDEVLSLAKSESR
jgi:WS/DGAT/MGAT family acyltransferase